MNYYDAEGLVQIIGCTEHELAVELEDAVNHEPLDPSRIGNALIAIIEDRQAKEDAAEKRHEEDLYYENPNDYRKPNRTCKPIDWRAVQRAGE